MNIKTQSIKRAKTPSGTIRYLKNLEKQYGDVNTEITISELCPNDAFEKVSNRGLKEVSREIFISEIFVKKQVTKAFYKNATIMGRARFYINL